MAHRRTRGSRALSTGLAAFGLVSATFVAPISVGTANALEPGEEAGYWHSHSRIEELYVFLGGQGEMGLDDDIVQVSEGSVVRVGQGVWRTWRAVPDSRRVK